MAQFPFGNFKPFLFPPPNSSTRIAKRYWSPGEAVTSRVGWNIVVFDQVYLPWTLRTFPKFC